MLASGLTMEQSLNALIEEAAQPLVRDALAGVKAEISAGSSLPGALCSYPRSFPEFYRALVHGGEESGALAAVVLDLADYLDARQALKQKTTLSLLYPLLTRVMIGFSDFLRVSWPYSLLLSIAAAAGMRAARQNATLRRRFDALLLRMPG